MRRLFLIKHALPVIVPGTPAHLWELSEEGREQALRLASLLALRDLSCVVASEEPKARDTGRIVAEKLGVPFFSYPGLHEHPRATVPYGSTAEFANGVRAFFARPSELVLGEETADQSHSRFRDAIQEVMQQSAGNVAVATHGTVITLLVARANGLGEFSFWGTLGLPALVEVSWPELKLVGVTKKI